MADKMNIEWSALLFRLTAFINPNIQQDSSKWWESLVGELPDEEKNNPKLHQKIILGHYTDMGLALETQIGRVDWRLTGMPINQPIPISAGDFHPVEKLLPPFLDITERWLKIAPPITRLAFGAQFGIPVDSKNSGYKILSKYMHAVNIDVEGSSDLVYQINRARNSKIVENLHINRLTKWAVAAFTTTSIPSDGIQLDERVFAASVELDINTAANHTDEFRAEDIVPMFLELKDLGFEIAEKGDVP